MDKTDELLARMSARESAVGKGGSVQLPAHTTYLIDKWRGLLGLHGRSATIAELVIVADEVLTKGREASQSPSASAHSE